MRTIAPLTLHVPTLDLAGFYEAGWSLVGTSDSPHHVVIAWQCKRAPVVPYKHVAEIMERRESVRRVGEMAG